jgi:hypothetical protein
VVKFKYFGRAVTNQNRIHKKLRADLVQGMLFRSSFLPVSSLKI